MSDQPCSQIHRSPWWVMASIALVAVLHFTPFTLAYRLTADDNFFLEIFLQGPGAIWAWTENVATIQGRVGQYIMMPLNIIASYLAGFQIARIVFIAAYASIFVAFARYVSILLQAQLTPLLVIILLAMHPLAYEHMPPTAYPLQNTVPFLAILLVRTAILKSRHGASRGRFQMVVLHAVFAFAMLITEFAFLFGTALLAAEHIREFLHVHHKFRSLPHALLATLQRREFAGDLAIVLAILAAYVTYRLINPSTYDGNSFDGLGNIPQFVFTTFRHITDGTSFPRLRSFSKVEWWAWIVAAVIGILTGAVVLATAHRAMRLHAPLLVASVGLMLMIYVTVPLSATAKQQGWCVDGWACGYLDSRTSYLGFGPIVACLMSFILARLSKQWMHTCYKALTAITVGMVASATFAANWNMSHDMAKRMIPWERADLIACHPAIVATTADDILLKIIDPGGKILFHPHLDQVHFWKLYLAGYKSTRQCADTAAERRAEIDRIESFLPFFDIGETVRIGGETGGQFLLRGWSAVEDWGVWSDQEKAELLILPRMDDGVPLELTVGFLPYFGQSVTRQTIHVSVDGKPIDAWKFDSASSENDCCTRSIRLPKKNKNDPFVVGFRFDHLRDISIEPEKSDARKLAMALRFIRLSEVSH